MKRLFYITVIYGLILLSTYANAQNSGTLWIKTFNAGSNDLNDPGIDKKALMTLDSLMQIKNIEVTFWGAADDLKWNLDGRSLHTNISDALNDAKRLGRARALKARYGRGNIGITHESVAGVKVQWTIVSKANFTQNIDQLRQENHEIKKELDEVKNQIQSLKPEQAANGHHSANGNNGNHSSNGSNDNSHLVVKEGLTFNWRLQAGMWTWQSRAKGSILSPSVALNIIIGKTAFVIQGGVTPWHIATEFGNQSESFVYTGIKYMKNDRFGFTIGGFRGWKFFTDTDNWSFKTTGIATGIVIQHKFVELNPTLTYSSVNALDLEGRWRLGGSLGLNININ
ncbi:MAG: hypothetical protein ACE5HS_10225 [bacterium]